MDTAAPPVLAFRRRSTGAPLALDPALEIGAGGEARVLGVPGDDALVAKLYRNPTLERARKLARMMEAPPVLEGGASLAWPVDLLMEMGGRFAGFLMPRAEGPRIFEFYNPVSRRRAAPFCDWEMLHRGGMGLAAAFDGLHARGYVVGDVNESNILLAPAIGRVTLVDADSFQVREPAGGAVHRSGVGKAEFTPPELQGARFADVDRTPEHDRFGLAVLLFLLLMEGTHPFAMRFAGDGEALPVEERIRRGLYPHARADDDCRPPRLAPPNETLHPPLQALFARCFVAGHANPAARPAAAEWRDALALAAGGLRTCGQNPRHRFGAHVPFCPWCHRRQLLQGRDPFPASVEIALATDRAPIPGRAAQLPRQWARPPAPAPMPATPVSILPQQQPAGPSPVAVFLGSVQAALPPWLAGPAALGSPVPWIAPVALTVLFGAGGGVRTLAMLVGYAVLRHLFRAGLGRVTRLTAAWVVVMLLLWSLFSGLSAGGSYAAEGADADVSADAVVPTVLSTRRGDALDMVEVDRAPYLENQEEVDDAIAAAVASSPWPPSRSSGTVVLRFVVDADGAVDPATISVAQAPTFEVGSIAQGIARLLRFVPAQRDGVPVAMWMDYTLTLPPRDP